MGNQIFHVEGRLYLFLNKATDIFLCSLLLFLFSLPIVTAGAAMSGFYCGLMKINEETDRGVWRDFWSGFSNAFSKATMLWMMEIMLVALLTVNLLIGLNMGTDLGTVLMVMNGMLLLAVLAVAQYAYPMAGYFDFSIAKLLHDAGATALACLPHSLGLLALAAICGIAAYFIPYAFIFVAPVYGYQVARVNVWIFHRYCQSCEEKQENNREGGVPECRN